MNKEKYFTYKYVLTSLALIVHCEEHNMSSMNLIAG